MKVYVSNSFSLGMLEVSEEIIVKVKKVSEEEVKSILQKHKHEIESAVGHQSLASFLSKKLGVDISFRRIQIKLRKGDILVVYQLLQRLPEGAILSEKELEKIPAIWYIVQII